MKMKPLTLSDISRVTGGKYIGDTGLADTCITGVVRDNRQVKPGNLFLCIHGARVDGHDFAPAAYKAGAACCLAEHELPEPAGPYVLVTSTLEALKALGEYYRGLFDIPIIGVTGSVGKTTAKEMISAALSAKFNVLKTPENLNNEIGVPLTLLSMCQEHTAAVIEMGISDFGEMHRLSKMVRPDICLITTIGYCHLENLGDLNGVLKAKTEVLDYMPESGAIVVNGDDEMLSGYETALKKITFGMDRKNDYYAKNVTSYGSDSVSCIVCGKEGEQPLTVNAFGSHMALSMLPAASIGYLLGMTGDEISRGIASYATVGGRAAACDTGYITVIDDCYNANPNSVTASLKSLAMLDGRRVAILGDMKELGYRSQELHREIGELAGKCGIDCLICCGNQAEYIYKGLVKSGSSIEAWFFPLKEALFSRLPSLIHKGDKVLVKASRSMHFEEISRELKKLT